MLIRFRALFVIALVLPALAQQTQPKGNGGDKQAAKPVATAPAPKSEGLTVDGIIALVGADLSDDVIIARLRKENKSFDLTTDEMIRLKNAKVSGAVMQVMLDPKAGIKSAAGSAQAPQSVSTPGPVPATSSPALPPSGRLRKILDFTKQTVKEGATGTGQGEPPAAVVQQISSNPASPAAPVSTMRETDHPVWDSKYGRMTIDDLQRINDATVRFDLNYFRLNPAALDQKPAMQYFIALNNCNDRNVERALFNELDYPALAAFYRSKAPQILSSLPGTVTDVALYRYIGGGRSGNWVLWSQSLSLGEYDRQRRAFPLKYPGKDRVEISDSLSAEASRNLTQGCPAAAKAAAAAKPYLPATYVISLKPAVYRELPMDEDAARKYIDRTTSRSRNVFLAVDVTILDSVPNVSRTNNAISQVSFRAEAARIRVIDANTQEPLGALFDDHSLPAEVQVAQAPAPPQPKPADSFAFGDHMYDIRTAAYVVLAADACGWPLTAEQSANVHRFVDHMSTKGNFNERYQYNLAATRATNTINANGRRNYCADVAERRKFDKLAATVAPLGPLAAPSR